MIDALPNEVLTSIFEQIAPIFSTPIKDALKATATLANVSRSSRRLHQLAEPLIYRTVVFERFVKGPHFKKDAMRASHMSISGLDVLRQHPFLGRNIRCIRAEEFSIFRLQTVPDSHEELMQRIKEDNSQPIATYLQDVVNDLKEHTDLAELWLKRETALLAILTMAPNLEACDLSLGRVIYSPVARHFEAQGEQNRVEAETKAGRVRQINMRYDQEVVPHYLDQLDIAALLFLPRLESVTLDFRCGSHHVNDSSTRLLSKYGPRPHLRHLKIINAPLVKIGPISDILACFPQLETLALHTPLQISGIHDDYSRMGDALRAHGRNLRRFELAATYEKYELMRNVGGIGSLREDPAELEQLRIAFARLTGWNAQMGLREGNRTLHVAEHLPRKLRYLWTAMGDGGRQEEVGEHTLALEEMFADAAEGMLPDLEWVLVHSAVLERRWNCLPRGWEVDWFVHRHARMSFYLFRKRDGVRLGSAEAPPGWNVWPVTEFVKRAEDRGKCGCLEWSDENEED